MEMLTSEQIKKGDSSIMDGLENRMDYKII